MSGSSAPSTRQDSRARNIGAALFLGPHQVSQQTVVAAQRFRDPDPMFWSYLGSQVPPAQRLPRA